MSVDQRKLENIIENLQGKVDDCRSEYKIYNDLYIMARDINLVNTTMEDRSTEKVLPNDKVLGTEITVERREDIYEHLLTKYEELL